MTKYIERINSGLSWQRHSFGCIIDTIFPWHCIVCGLKCSRPGICRPCKTNLPWNHRACLCCALPLPSTADTVCGACLVKAPVYESVLSPFLFRFPVNRLIHQFKFNRKLAAGSVLGHLACEAFMKSAPSLPDLLVPVPMHRLRLVVRGLNPAFELARHIGNSLGIPVAVHDLQRRRHTPAQSGLDAVSRRRNLKGAFRWRGGGLDGMNVAIVDDVMTTGSTIAECTRVLRREGAATVTGWILSRAVKGND